MAAGPPLPSPHSEKVEHNQSPSGPFSISQIPTSISFTKKIGEAPTLVPIPSFQPSSQVSHGNNGQTNRNQSQSSSPIGYADVVKGKSNSFSIKEPAGPLMDITTLNSTFQGKPAILFPSMAKNVLVNRCKFVLVGKFSHGRPSLSSLNLFFIKLKLKCAINITNFDSKHIFLECSCKEDFYRIWLGLVWYVEGLAMRVFKWFPDFSCFKESSIAPVWITVAGLPLYMFEESALLSVAKAVGDPIKVDPRNINRSIVNIAWICVELDVKEPLVRDVWVSFVDENGKEQLDGFWIKISYEVVPPFCSFCQHIGHTHEFCKRKLEQEKIVVANDILVGLEDNNQTKIDSVAAQNIIADSEYVKITVAAGAISLGVEKEGAAIVGPGKGELVGKKDLRQLEGMLANRMVKSRLNATSSRISVNPKAQKPFQRKKKVYQAKKQPPVSCEGLEINKNSFAILEEVEDLSLEEGEIDGADVCADAAIGYHVKTLNNLVQAAAAVSVSKVGSAGYAVTNVDSVSAISPMSAKSSVNATYDGSPTTYNGSAAKGIRNGVEAEHLESLENIHSVQYPAGDFSTGQGFNGVEAGFQKLANGKVDAAQHVTAGESVKAAGVENSSSGQITGAAPSTKQAAGAITDSSKTTPAAGYHGAGHIVTATNSAQQNEAADFAVAAAGSGGNAQGERDNHTGATREFSASTLGTKMMDNKYEGYRATATPKGLSSAAAEFTPGVRLQKFKLADQHGSQVTRYGSSFLSDDMGDIICAFKCKSVPNSPSRSRKQSKSIYDSPVYSPATIALCKKYGSDTSDDFDGSWEDYD